MEIWDLDRNDQSEAKRFAREKGYDQGKHEKFKVGDIITFFTGYNDDIRARARIKGIDGEDLYVYDDCYWFPIQDDHKRQIEIEVE